MMPKQVSYNTTNSYDTLNSLNASTKHVWIVCHGIGYLSRYFIRLFDALDQEENYIIAPQAPSKYYKDEQYRKVGASWLTKENTKMDIQNVLRYMDAVLHNENIPEYVALHIIGYSQGVSIVGRWVASRKIKCNSLVLISGGFPKELDAHQFNFLPKATKVIHVLGEKDPYFDEEIVTKEKLRLRTLLPQIDFRTHPGGHELDLNSFKSLILDS